MNDFVDVAACPLSHLPIGRGDHCGFCYCEDEEQFKTQLLATIAYCGLAIENHRRVVTGEKVMTALEMRGEMLEKRRQAFHRERAWWWSGPTGKIKIGVLQGLGDSWIVGHIQENGARKKLNSAQLAKYQPSTDPDRLLEIVEEWAKQRELQEVQW